MGSARRMKPARLGEKLLAIRKGFDLSLSEMAEALSDKKAKVHKQDVSRFERGEREPSLIVLLRYARMARVSMEVLADDSLDLPK